MAQCVSSGMGASHYALYKQYTRKEYNREWRALHGTFFPILNSLPSIYLLFVYFVNGFGELVEWHMEKTLYLCIIKALPKFYEILKFRSGYSQGKSE